MIRNYITDIKLRHHLHATLADDTEAIDHQATHVQHGVEWNLDFHSYFVHEDLKIVRAWSPRQRLVVLGWYGLWSKLPPTDQTSILAAVSPRVPFPVPNFLAWAERERTFYLAQALEVKPNTITQIRLRSRGALLRLRLIQELRPSNST